MREVAGYRSPLAGIHGGQGIGDRQFPSADIEYPRDQGTELLGGELLGDILIDWGGGLRDDV